MAWAAEGDEVGGIVLPSLPSCHHVVHDEADENQ